MATKTITGAYSAGYDLKPVYADLTITNTASVGGTGVITDHAHATVTNYGDVSGTTLTSPFAGVYFKGSGELINTSGAKVYGFTGVVDRYPVLGTVSNNGSIGGRYDGVEFIGGGTITNNGAIVAGHYGIDLESARGTIDNYGSIEAIYKSGGYDVESAITMGAGSVRNGSQVLRGALISGVDGVMAAGKATVSNYGTIQYVGTHFQGRLGELGSQFGISLAAGGTVVNGSGADTEAVIDSLTGVSASGVTNNGSVTVGATVKNFATIIGYRYQDLGTGVYLINGAVLINGGPSATEEGALVRGQQWGVQTQQGAVQSTVHNYGTIQALGPVGAAGVYLRVGGVLTNGSAADTAALIRGFSGVYGETYGTVSNFATIQGTGASTGGYGVSFNVNSPVTLTNGSTKSHAALIEGYSGVKVRGTASTVANYGTILAQAKTSGHYAVEQTYLGVLVNGTAADDTALVKGYSGVFDGGGGSSSASVVNYGTIDAVNGAAHGAQEFGVVFNGDGSLTNGALTDHAAIIEGYRAVTALGGVIALTNYGRIEDLGSKHYAAVDALSGMVTNGAVSDATAMIKGAAGVQFETAGTVLNLATIIADETAGVIANGGTVINGAAPDTKALIEGSSGVDESASATLANFGTVNATVFGVYFNQGGVITNGAADDKTALIEADTGVDTDGATSVVNDATIRGRAAFGDYGVILSGAGVSLTNGSSQDAGAVIEGYGGARIYGITTAASVTNVGTMLGTGHAKSSGAYLGGAVDLTNDGGLIKGLVGVTVGPNAAGDTVANYGMIDGTGGVAVQFKTPGVVLAVDPNSSFDGLAIGDGGTLEFAAGSGNLLGLLTSAGDYTGADTGFVRGTFNDFDTLAVAKNADLTLVPAAGQSGSEVYAGQTLTIAGVLQSPYNIGVDGSIITTGNISGSGSLAVNGGSASFNIGTTLGMAEVRENGVDATISVGMNLDYGGYLDQRSGTLAVASNYLCQLAYNSVTPDYLAGTIAGPGYLQIDGGGQKAAAYLDNVTIAPHAGVLISQATVEIGGYISNSGVLTLSDYSLGAHGSVRAALTTPPAGVTLAGGGFVDMLGSTQEELDIHLSGNLVNLDQTIEGFGYDDIVGNAFTITNSSRGTIRAIGEISGASLVNFGTISSVFTISAASVANYGLIEWDLAQSGLIQSPIRNSGTIQVTTTGGSLSVEGAITNTGTLLATAGTLELEGAVTGAGVVRIDAGTADFTSAAGALAEKATFVAGSTGVLELGDPQGFTGTVYGFTAKNQLILGVNFAGNTAPTFSGGVLTVTEGSNTVTIKLSGTYTTDTFTAAANAQGLTLVTVQPSGATRSPSIAQLLTAMAASALAPAATTAQLAQTRAPPEWRLAAPHISIA